MPPIFSSNRIAPIGRSMPRFVPIPISPSRRAPASVSSVASRYSWPRSARASTTTPARNSSSIPATSTPRGLEGIVKRIRPSAESSCGPVKTSPDGMLRLPSELTHVRPPTRSRRSVPSASIRSSSAPLSRSISRACRSRSSPHAASGSVAVEEQRALDERAELGRAHARLLGRGGRRPERAAPAACASAPRGSAPAPARRGPGAPGRRPRAPSCCPAPGSRARRRCPPPRPARRARTRRGGGPARPPTSPRPGRAAPCAAAARRRGPAARAGARAAAARRAWSSETTTCWPGCASRQ